MSKAIEQVLGYVNILGVIEAVKSGLPVPFPKEFLTLTEGTVGDYGTLTRTRGQRRVARQTAYGSPARRREQKGVESVPVKLLHSFEEINLNPQVLHQLRALDSYTNDQGKQEVARQVREFVQLYHNSRIMSVVQALVYGAIYYDANGNLLPTSSGASLTVDLGVSANHKNQLNGLIAATWATTSTNIPQHIRNIKKQSRIDTGWEIEHCYYGSNIVSYLQTNEYVKDWWTRNSGKNEELLTTSEIPDNFLGIKKWYPIYDAFFEDNDGTTQSSVVGGDVAVFCPAPSKEWYTMVEGTYMVPTTINLMADAAQYLASMKPARGMFGYSAISINPPTINMYHGDTWLPWFLNPDAVYIADVTP